MIKFNTLSW